MMKSLGGPPNLMARGFIGVLALAGFISVFPVSVDQWSEGAACPLLGPIPACYLVFAAYGILVLLVVHPVLWNAYLFGVCWFVLFGLATLGSGFELAGVDTCPKTETGIPKCFFSWALAASLVLPLLIRYVKFRNWT